MTAPTINPNVRPLQVRGGVPKEGPAVVPVNLDFSLNPAYTVDLTNLFNGGFLKQILCIYADNSANPSPLTVQIPDTNQKLVWPPYSQGYIPVLQTSNLKFAVSCANKAIGGALEFLNFPVAASVWSVGGMPLLTAGGAMPVSDAVLEQAISNNMMQVQIAGGLSYTDASNTITTGGTQQVALAANASRKAVQLMNISAGDLWYRWTGNAAIAGAGSFKLVAGAYYESAPGLVSTQQLSIIGATGGQAFSLAWA